MILIHLQAVSPLPVMVFLHGGGYVSGSGSRLLYGPELFMDRQVIILIEMGILMLMLRILSKIPWLNNMTENLWLINHWLKSLTRNPWLIFVDLGGFGVHQLSTVCAWRTLHSWGEGAWKPDDEGPGGSLSHLWSLTTHLSNPITQQSHNSYLGSLLQYQCKAT